MGAVILDGGRIPSDLVKFFEPVELGQIKDVFVINPGSFPGAHFATWPPALVEPMIKAGTSEKGKCPECGSPWKRITKKGNTAHNGNTDSLYAEGSTANRPALLRQAAREQGGEYANTTVTTGWEPGCDCNHDVPISCTVLDPFGGAGTTGLVAERLGRDSVLIELNPEYVQMARKRIVDDAPMLNQVIVRV